VEVLGATYAARTKGEAVEAGGEILVEGFDPFGLIVREATAAETAPVPSPSSPRAQPWGSAIGDFFLWGGAGICFLMCVFAVLSIVYELWSLMQVFSLITPAAGDLLLQLTLLLWTVLGGLVTFVFFAALLVVFMRVLRLK
jgi:hypothetical protein